MLSSSIFFLICVDLRSKSIAKFIFPCAFIIAICISRTSFSAERTTNEFIHPASTEIWLAGLDPVVQSIMAPSTHNDFLDLFNVGAPWAKAGAQVNVFKVSTQFLLHSSDQDLRKLITGLNDRGIALGFEALMVPKTERCGSGIEGYSSPGEIAAAAKRVNRLGGTLRYAAMDEPLWFGHVVAIPNSCQSSIKELARLIAINVAALRSVFPSILIGDIEPVAATSAPPDWNEEIIEFTKEYEQASGTNLAFFHADINWSGTFKTAIEDLQHKLKTENISFGIIYNGDASDADDSIWTHRATDRYENLEEQFNLDPDAAVFQTWTLNPTHFMPETRNGTMTNLVLGYSRLKTRITIRQSERDISGKLIDENGTPLVAQRLDLFLIDPDAAATPTWRSVDGVTPVGATTALFGLRINSECACSGVGHLRLGLTKYLDDSHQSITRTIVAVTNTERFADLVVTKANSLSLNSEPFVVKPSTRFTVSAELDATESMEESGYLMLAFFNAYGKEIRRVEMTFSPSERSLTSTETKRDGAFRIELLKAMKPSEHLKAVFYGNKHLRRSQTISDK